MLYHIFKSHDLLFTKRVHFIIFVAVLEVVIVVADYAAVVAHSAVCIAGLVWVFDVVYFHVVAVALGCLLIKTDLRCLLVVRLRT